MEQKPPEHYYGNSVRTLFIITGILMVVSLPFFSSLLNIPLYVSLIAILGLAVFGGFLNPVQKWIIVANTVISVAAFVGFEYYAVHTYKSLPPDVPLHVAFFWINQAFALLFFLAVYLSVKTLRGKILKNNG